MSNPPPLEYARPEPKRPWPKSWLPWTLIACVFAVLVLVAVIVPTAPSPEKRNRLICLCNLRTIWLVATMYASEYHGILAPDLQTMFDAEGVRGDYLVCPADSASQAVARNTARGSGACSYLYVGSALTTPSDPKSIMALEDPANHGLKGGGVLFADGHTEFLDLPTTQRILNELNAGRNPPATLTPNLSQAAAEQDYQKNWKPRMPQLKTGVWRIPTTQPAKPE